MQFKNLNRKNVLIKTYSYFPMKWRWKTRSHACLCHD